MTSHLTHEQLCDIVLARSPHPLSSDFAALEIHLHACPDCTRELSNLSNSLALFRDASASIAGQQQIHLDADQMLRATSARARRPSFLQPIYWAAAAAILVIVGAIPLSSRRQSPSATPVLRAVAAPAHTVESDEALLNDIARTLSVSVPAPMNPLADPTAGAAATSSTSPQRKN